MSNPDTRGDDRAARSAGGDSDAAAGFRKPAGGWPTLDGLRGIAVLLVIAVHYLGTFAETHPDAGPFFRLARGGWVGVDLFFALSGFLITGILIDALGQAHYYRNFYARRTLRIFPLYYGCLALIFGLGALLPVLQTEGFRQIASNQAWLWLYASNLKVAMNQQWQTFGLFGGGWVELSHLWSLAIEEQFYLVWPALLAVVPKQRWVHLVVVAFVTALLLRLAFIANGNVIAAYVLMPCRMDALAVGAFVAIVARRDSGTRILLRWARPAALAAFFATVVLWFIRGDFWQRDPVVAGVGFSFVAVLSGCMLVFAVSLPVHHPLSRFLSLRWLREVGRVSYGMYLIHFALLKILFLPITPVDELAPLLGSEAAVIALRFGLVVGFSYALAWASFHFYERRFLALKRYFGTADRSLG